VRSGWDALTAAERDVIAMVAAGASNDEIAARLLIGRATVRTHLNHVYTKLGLPNRAALAAAAARRDEFLDAPPGRNPGAKP
jgi:DNA-binding CsgD family transcriptional regulator